MPSLTTRLPSFWKVQAAGWLVYLVMIYITFLTVVTPENFLSLFYLKSFRALTGFCLTSFIMRPIYKKSGNLSIQSNILLVIALAIIFGCVWAAIEGVYYYVVEGNFNLPGYLKVSPRIALDYAMTITAWSALYFGVKFWWVWQRGQKDLIEARGLANQAQLEMLRYQLNPHFLFNALNSIQGSIDEDSSRSKKMVIELSEFLRYSLLNNKEEAVPLSEEIQAVQNYLSIEKIRFEDKLEVSFEIDRAAENFRVPCFLLNPLVENAIKHGFDKRRQLLKLCISAKMKNGALCLEVANTGRLKNDNDGGTKVGLKNVRERLDKHFHERGHFTLEEDKGRVRAQIIILPG